MKPEGGIIRRKKGDQAKKGKGGGEESEGDVQIRTKYNATYVWKCSREANYFANLKMKKNISFFCWWNAEEAKDNQMKLCFKTPSLLSS